MLDLGGNGPLVPAQFGCDEFGDVYGGLEPAVPGLDRDSGTAGEHIVQVQCPLMGGGVHDLRRQVGAGPAYRPSELGPLPDKGEDLLREGAVAPQQVLDPGHVDPDGLGERLPRVPQRRVAVGAEEGNPIGAGRRYVTVHPVHGRVDRVPGHHPVRGVLPAGHHGQAGQWRDHRVFPGQVGGVLRLARQQRPQPRIDTGDVVGGQRRAQHPVEAREEVVDVGAAGSRVGEVEVPVRVGRSDNPVTAPGDHEQHAGLGAQDQPGGGVDPVPRHHQMDALGDTDRQLATPTGHRLDVVGPHARGVDGLAGANVDLPAAFEVVDTHPRDPVALAQQARHPGAGGDQRAVVGGGPGDEHRVPGVVDLGVPVLDRAHQGVRAQRGDGTQRGPPGQVTVVRYLPAAAEGVVEHHSAADVGAFPRPVGEREQERNRVDEVWAERVQ